MSKIGKKPITLLDGISIREVDKNIFEIQGPKGKVNFELPQEFKLEIEDKILKVIPQKDLNKNMRALYGTLRALLNNRIIGVSQGFEKVLILEGLGYSAEIKGKEIFIKVGFSQPVKLEIPHEVDVEVKSEKGKSFIYVRGIDKEKVGLFASQIKNVKPADRYHAKGFRYLDEVIKLKPVKKTVK